MTRIEQLLNFLNTDPDDPFILFCLALEYEKNDIDQALFYYKKLLIEHESYTGTYYHAAKLLLCIGNREEAEEIYKKGLNITLKFGKIKNYQELQRAYNSFLNDNELDV